METAIRTEIQTSVKENVPVLEEFHVCMEDDGIVLRVKSAVIGDWVKGLSEKSGLGTFELEAAPGSCSGKYYRLPTRLLNQLHNDGINVQVKFSISPPSLFWIAAVGLSEGVTITCAAPVLLPADLVELVNGTCELVKMLYLHYVKTTSVSAKVTEIRS